MPEPPPLRVDPADLDRPADADAVLALLRAFALEPVSGGRDLPEAVRARLVPGLRAHSGSRIWLAWLDDPAPAAVGVAICQIGFSTFLAQPTLNLHDLFVRAEHRGHRVGAALMHAVHEGAATLGCGKVTLEVNRDNAAAQRFYRRLGYRDGSPGERGDGVWFWHRPIAG